MVFFFTSCNSAYIIYMGKDKFENEELIRWGIPTDLWFHVDKLSSAHVYLRLPDGISWENIPADVLTDCIQLVKANSIDGNKQDNVRIVYTPWANLKKKASMEIGQVGFHEEKQVKYATVITRDNTIVNRLNKTREEKPTEIAKQTKEEYDAAQKQKTKAQKIKEEEELRRKKEEWAKEKESRSYDKVLNEDNMVSNKQIKANAKDFEEDFM